LGLFLTVFEIGPLIAWNFPLKIASKPLQMKIWLLLTVYKKSPAPYRRPFTTYGLATIPHDYHTIVRYDPSRSSNVTDLMSFES